MGKTYKDKNKWDRKQRVNRDGSDDSLRESKGKSKRIRFDEVLPDGEELDPYEDYADEY
jgi:hypothetical protein